MSFSLAVNVTGDQARDDRVDEVVNGYFESGGNKAYTNDIEAARDAAEALWADLEGDINVALSGHRDENSVGITVVVRKATGS
jgi:hypothetical protein